MFLVCHRHLLIHYSPISRCVRSDHLRRPPKRGEFQVLACVRTSRRSGRHRPQNLLKMSQLDLACHWLLWNVGGDNSSDNCANVPPYPGFRLVLSYYFMIMRTIESLWVGSPQLYFHFGIGIHWIPAVNDELVTAIIEGKVIRVPMPDSQLIMQPLCACLCPGMPRLRSLNLDGCKSVALASVQMLLQRRAKPRDFACTCCLLPCNFCSCCCRVDPTHLFRECLCSDHIVSGQQLTTLGLAFLSIPKVELDRMRKVYPNVKLTI